MATPIRAVLVEPPEAGTLAPLLEDRPFALLPIGNRPLAAHTLAAFAEAGIRDVEIVSERFAARVRAVLGDGSQWGVILRHRQVADCAQAWDALVAAGSRDGDTLLWRLDVVPEVDDVRAVLAAPAACIVECFGLEPDALPVRLLRGAGPAAPARARLSRVVLVREAGTFWRANLRALRVHATRHHVERRFGRSTFIDALAVVHESATLEEPCLIGAHTHVAAQARVGRDAVVGSDVHVGEGVLIVESVVLAGTLIGPHLQLRRKIVDGSRIIDVETGTVVYIADPRIIGRFGAPLVDCVSARERALAAAAGLVVLPPAALWCAARTLLRRPALRHDVVSRPVTRSLDGSVLTRATTRWSLATAHAGWSRAPWLVDVMRGQLPLAAALAVPSAPGVHGTRPDDSPGCASPARSVGRWLRSLLRVKAAGARAGAFPGRGHPHPPSVPGGPHAASGC
jgi:hypothetical protein